MVTSGTMELLTKYKIETRTKRHLADTYTPVSIYLKLRDKYTESVLLESTDFRSAENCFSFIGVEPIARFTAQGNTVTELFTDGSKIISKVPNSEVLGLFKNFIEQFEVSPQNADLKDAGVNGFFGHTSFDAVQYFDTLVLDKSKRMSSRLEWLPRPHASRSPGRLFRWW